jgi:hypothetical protein
VPGVWVNNRLNRRLLASSLNTPIFANVEQVLNLKRLARGADAADRASGIPWAMDLCVPERNARPRTRRDTSR